MDLCVTRYGGVHHLCIMPFPLSVRVKSLNVASQATWEGLRRRSTVVLRLRTAHSGRSLAPKVSMYEVIGVSVSSRCESFDSRMVGEKNLVRPTGFVTSERASLRITCKLHSFHFAPTRIGSSSVVPGSCGITACQLLIAARRLVTSVLTAPRGINPMEQCNQHRFVHVTS
jgi:hypothetical protein